jgi:hypothetical protein
MTLIKDKYRGDHSRSKYLRKNQTIKNPQVQSQYVTTDQKLVAQSRKIQDNNSNVIGVQNIAGYHIPQNTLTSIGSISPGEVLDFINLSYSGSGSDHIVSLLWSFLDPISITSSVETGEVSITEGNAFFITIQTISASKYLGGAVLDDFKIANPKKTIYLYTASSESNLNVTVVKNGYTNK